MGTARTRAPRREYAWLKWRRCKERSKGHRGQGLQSPGSHCRPSWGLRLLPWVKWGVISQQQGSVTEEGQIWLRTRGSLRQSRLFFVLFLFVSPQKHEILEGSPWSELVTIISSVSRTRLSTYRCSVNVCEMMNQPNKHPSLPGGYSSHSQTLWPQGLCIDCAFFQECSSPDIFTGYFHNSDLRSNVTEWPQMDTEAFPGGICQIPLSDTSFSSLLIFFPIAFVAKWHTLLFSLLSVSTHWKIGSWKTSCSSLINLQCLGHC